MAPPSMTALLYNTLRLRVTGLPTERRPQFPASSDIYLGVVRRQILIQQSWKDVQIDLKILLAWQTLYIWTMTP